MNEKVYETLGEVFSETMEYEPFLSTGELAADTALYFSYASKMDYRNNQRRRALIPYFGEKYQHIECVLGAAKALRNAHIPYRIITAKDLKTLSRNRVIILSDVVFLSPEEEDALVEYVRQGGSLYMSGITPATLVNRILGLKISGMTKETVTYMRPTAEGQQYFSMDDPANPMTIFDKHVLAENPGGHRVLAAITLPYTDPARSDIFASIHSNPPGIDTESPAIVSGVFGSGKAIWAAAPFEQSSQPVHKQVFANLIGSLNTAKPAILSAAPVQVEFIIFRDENILQLHCVNIQEQTPIIPLPAFTVRLFTDRNPKKVKLLPGEEEIPFTFSEGYAEFKVEGIHIFRMYQIEL
jgi:hypothetical protein